MQLSVAHIELPGVRLEGENPLPFFRSWQDLGVGQSPTSPSPLQADELCGAGKSTAFRVLPYKMQDRYTRNKETQKIPSLVLENETLVATFLPDYGARLYSLHSKSQNRELLFKNPVLQFANLAICNAWFSGGIEWNVSQFGHTFQTCSPVHALRCSDAQGNEFLRVYNFERCKEIYWQIDFHLPAGSQTLQSYVKIINDKAAPESSYWWTNIAVAESSGVRILAPAPRVLYLDPESVDSTGQVPEKSTKNFGACDMPYLPPLPDADASYPQNFSYSNEYFFQNQPDSSVGSAMPAMPWEAAVYKDGRIFFERSSLRLRYRKMFCWGSHAGGQRWKDFLAQPGCGNYVEIQAGLAATQLHGIEIPAQSSWDFVQVFGELDHAYQPSLHEKPWGEAAAEFAAALEQQLPSSQIECWESQYRELGQQKFTEPVYAADGWGALEEQRKARAGEALLTDAIPFPETSLGSEQQEWLHLLEYGFLREPESAITGGDSRHAAPWLISKPWMRLLEQSLAKPEGRHWHSYLHLGVMYYEQQWHEKALSLWQQSISLKENPLAYRNLGYHYRQSGHIEKSLEYYRRVFSLNVEDHAYAEEYLEFLLELGRFAEVWDFWQESQEQYRPPTCAKIAILAGYAAAELGHLDYVAALLHKEFPQIKEGDNWLTDIWFLAQAQKLATEQDIANDAELRRKVREMYTPPKNIDFRMISSDTKYLYPEKD